MYMLAPGYDFLSSVGLFWGFVFVCWFGFGVLWGFFVWFFLGGDGGGRESWLFVFLDYFSIKYTF